MADLVFKQGIAAQYNAVALDKTSDNTLEEITPTGNYQARDVVRIVYTDTYEKAVYGVCTNAVTGEFTFDENIYPVGPSGITATIFKYNSADVYETSVYRVSVDVENGLYSKAYNQYASNISYSLIIPTKRDEYFGAASTIITFPDVAFVDLCDSKAYGVGLSDISLDTLNNKFKSSLEFNIATR
jgi:hypothetical protein